MAALESNTFCHLTEQEADRLKKGLPIDEEIQDLSEFFKIFGDPTRLNILFLLKSGEYCVHDIAALIGMNQAAVSHQLKLLRHARLVKYRKEGKQVFYSLNDEHIDAILAIGFDHFNE